MLSVQPPEPATGTAPPAPTGRKPRNRRLRLILALVGGVATLLCLGGVGVAISLYDEATEIKRSAPDAVVDNFLRAYLVNRDEKEVLLYSCKTGGDFAQLAAFRSDIVDRENKNSIFIRVSWEGLRVATAGTNGTVDTDLTKSVGDNEQITSSWRFAVIDQDGWRVCGAVPVL